LVSVLFDLFSLLETHLSCMPHAVLLGSRKVDITNKHIWINQGAGQREGRMKEHFKWMQVYYFQVFTVTLAGLSFYKSNC
jgi:hypothetical protein